MKNLKTLVCGIVAYASVCMLLHGQEARPLMREFMGINGHTVQFKPELYRPVCNLVRDYHPVEWDLGADSDYPLEFPFARNRVSWEAVYGSWRKKEFEIDACLMFETLDPSKWKNVQKDGYLYGKKFAQAFGPSSKGLVQTVEIGNEPGKWSDKQYEEMFVAMAKGIRDGDSKLRIATCNVNVGPSGEWHKSLDCVITHRELFDVINVHSYAMLESWPTWKRTYPEDPKAEKFLKDIDQLIAWRNEHAPEKEVWLTEFGWDASTQKPDPKGDFAKWLGNSDLEQAQWLVRAFLLLSSRDLNRAYVYFFNDDDKPSFHASSGITRGFEPKMSYHALSQLYRLLGDYRWKDFVIQSDDLWIAEYSHATDSHLAVWVAWSPTDTQREETLEIETRGATLLNAEKMATKNEATSISIPTKAGFWELPVSESPIYLQLKK